MKKKIFPKKGFLNPLVFATLSRQEKNDTHYRLQAFLFNCKINNMRILCRHWKCLCLSQMCLVLAFFMIFNTEYECLLDSKTILINSMLSDKKILTSQLIKEIAKFNRTVDFKPDKNLIVSCIIDNRNFDKLLLHRSS